MFMQDGKFRENIYEYCDNNVGGRVLFTGFVNLWSDKGTDMPPKDLVNLTSEILDNLIKQKIVIDVPKPKEFETVYAMYEILPHEKLIKDREEYKT